MLIRTKMRSMLKLEPDETILEWIISVVFIIFVIIVVLVVGPQDQPESILPYEQFTQEAIHNEN